MEKTCIKCGKLKPEEVFAWQAVAKKRRGNVCRECKAAYHRQYVDKNRKRYYKHIKRNEEIRVRKVRDFLFGYLTTHPCIDCGESNPVVLDFDHKDDAEKEFAIATYRSKGYSLKRVKREVVKCEIRCANCHRIRTARKRGYWILDYIE